MLKRIARAAAANPRLYEIIQKLAGREAVRREIERRVSVQARGRWLDIGSSSGSIDSTRLGSRLVQLDIDLQPLALARSRTTHLLAVCADASALPFRSAAFDVTSCFAVSHHLDDGALSRSLSEIARVTRETFVFFDAVRVDSRLLSRLLWKYDRGANPRTSLTLEKALVADFDVAESSSFTVLHRYVLFVLRPRRRA